MYLDSVHILRGPLKTPKFDFDIKKCDISLWQNDTKDIEITDFSTKIYD